ncbi:hypothetical protein [Streptomyces hygroscopicus]|uniref:hypothetical protein n=1 Tax=Streptomyces hygroscopicus TaxID=1912 RepID=UPI0004C86DB3|nr:hypothetical protein [Streptomyces hygroscopicus]
MPLVTPPVAPFEYCLHIPHDPRAVGVARASLRTALTAHELPELVERAARRVGVGRTVSAR